MALQNGRIGGQRPVPPPSHDARLQRLDVDAILLDARDRATKYHERRHCPRPSVLRGALHTTIVMGCAAAAPERCRRCAHRGPQKDNVARLRIDGVEDSGFDAAVRQVDVRPQHSLGVL
eukprot:713626-Prymnesium_polylepis.2